MLDNECIRTVECITFDVMGVLSSHSASNCIILKFLGHSSSNLSKIEHSKTTSTVYKHKIHCVAAKQEAELCFE